MLSKISYKTFPSNNLNQKNICFKGTPADEIGKHITGSLVRTAQEIKHSDIPTTLSLDWLNNIKKILKKNPEMTCKELADGIEKNLNQLGYSL